MSNTKVANSAVSDTRFHGKTIIITGAGGNFGRVGCLYFSERGANVAAMDNNRSALNDTLKEVVAAGCAGKIKGYICDVTNSESVEKEVQSISNDFDGRIDMLWNNAGYQGQIKPTLEYDPSDFARVMNINVTGMFIVLQSVAKRMASQASGADGNSHPFSIVNTASVAALRGTPAMVAYSSSKAAILAMTVSTAKDLAPHGIRVNAVSPALIGPGVMWTRQNELHATSGSPYFASDPEQVARAKIGGVPMKRLGTIDEVVKSVAFLLSDDSSYTTGTNLVVDGGLSSGLKA
mmetsp:Transcript_6568/g.14847  ORF Transcript_6568/g.14847 Transcript_6568/m.14847 type:complete len:292 (-) Transcript_6568:278-1153(-)|eukprot:CAMPEP_0172297720 /NCGR_PEP_ID=MMETSP1058-20130122/635_1 /TAXON_ID=83371 /ORGANISM="Detonula confervacea, Strain CCMP 353" /LENGTH=291 /DNA_ID=CAMNT_0013006899 /DNA_START=86 /DNA_END=961 /DNA_ORIENTATION=+